LNRANFPAEMQSGNKTSYLALYDVMEHNLYAQFFFFKKVGLACETRTLTYDNHSSLVSQATPFEERKGLVMLQPSSCRHGRNLMWPIRSVLFIAHICHHGVQLCHNLLSGRQRLIIW